MERLEPTGKHSRRLRAKIADDRPSLRARRPRPGRGSGTGHQRVWASPDLLVVGAYPPNGRYDLCRGSKAEHAKAVLAIPHVPLPETDPVFGKTGPLIELWRYGASKS